MEDVDTMESNEYDEEKMFLSDVVGDEHELLFLDSYLHEAFRGRTPHPATGSSSGDIGREETI